MFNDARFLKNTLYIQAWSFSLGLSFVSFVLFLQTPVISPLRLLIAGFLLIASIGLCIYVVRHWLAPRLEKIKNRQSVVLTTFLLPLLFLPLYFMAPDFPLSPLLREQTDVAVQFNLSNSSPVLDFPSDNVHLVIGKDGFSLSEFKAESGTESGERIVLPAGGSEFFRWQGPADSPVTLNITLPPADGTLTVYWDRNRTIYQLSTNSPTEIVMKHKYETPFALTALLFLSEYMILVFVTLFLAVLLIEFPAQIAPMPQDKKWDYALFIGAVLLSAIMLNLQLNGIVGGLATLNTEQLERHVDVLQGTAPDPWQYRVLSEWIAEGFVKLFGSPSRPDAIAHGFLSFRLLQNVAIFIVAYHLYKRLGDSSLLGLLGIALLASSMKNALFESDLSFNTYFDVLFYLMAALFILEHKYVWIVPLIVFATLNRETSGLIPFLLLYSVWNGDQVNRSKNINTAIISFAVWVMIFFGLRALYPDRPMFVPYDQAPGYPLLAYNLTRTATWIELFHTLGLIPFVGLPFFFAWHQYWRGFLFIMVPVWFIIHAFASVMAETRLFLVPQAIIFIPGILFLFNYLASNECSRTMEK